MSDRLSRRQFLSLNIESTLGFLGNFIAPQLEQERDFFRPPGAGDELDFLTSCTRCGLCKEQCPEGIIKLFSYAEGAKLANTPFIDPNQSPCTFCMKCVEVCEDQALSYMSKGSVAPIGTAKILEDSCLAFKGVMCDYCVRSCPLEKAIKLELDKPVIDESICNGCGKCISSCISEQKGIIVTLPIEIV